MPYSTLTHFQLLRQEIQLSISPNSDLKPFIVIDSSVIPHCSIMSGALAVTLVHCKESIFSLDLHEVAFSFFLHCLCTVQVCSMFHKYCVCFHAQ